MSLNIPTHYSNLNEVVYSQDFYRYESLFLAEFSDYINNTNTFHNEYEKLINNLPYDSIKLVEKIIERIIKITSLENFKDINLFSQEEKQNIYNNYNSKNSLRRYKNAQEFLGIVFPTAIEYELWTCLYKSGFVFFKDKRYQNSIIFDVGGFVGDSSLFIQKYTNSQVYTFEPEVHNFEIMKMILKANMNNKIKPHMIAFGEKCCKRTFYGYGIMSSFKEEKHHKESFISEIDVDTIDNFVNKHKKNPMAIKIDVEGAESLVISGATETLKNYKPDLIVSIYHNPEQFFNLKSQIQNLDLGYKFKIVKPDDGLILRKTTLLAYTN